jgi:hypothetical protein
MNVKNPAPHPILVEVFLEAEMIPEVIILPTAIIPMMVAVVTMVAVEMAAGADIDFVLK